MTNRIAALCVGPFATIALVCGCTAPQEPMDISAEEPTQTRQANTAVQTQTRSAVPVATAGQRAPVTQAARQTPIAPPAEIAKPVPKVPFSGTHPDSAINNGGFEKFNKDARFPVSWVQLLHIPVCEPEETIVKYGKRSVKLTGLTNENAALRSLSAPAIDELRGKEVTFGAWVYTSNPENMSVAIVYDWSQYRGAHPTKANEWQLMKVKATIPEDAEFLHFAVSLGASDDPTVCYVDGAALFVGPAPK